MNSLLISPDLPRFASDAAAVILDAIEESIEEHGRCMLVLSGGETPRRVYAQLASAPISRGINWDRVQIFFSDERCVPPDDPKSNFGMVRQELLSKITIPDRNIHRMRGELPPEEAAVSYETELRAVFSGVDIQFDLVLLGIGEDGHTASLFPGTTALAEYTRSVVSVHVPQLQTNRLTLTFPVLNRSRAILVLAAGRNKASVLRSVLTRDPESTKYPISGIRLKDGSIRWMLDKEAASDLPPNL